MMKSIPKQMILERKIKELDMDRIADLLCIMALSHTSTLVLMRCESVRLSFSLPKTSRHIWLRPNVKEWILEALSALTIS